MGTSRRVFLGRGLGAATWITLTGAAARSVRATGPGGGDAARFLDTVIRGDLEAVRAALLAKPALLDARDAVGRSAFALALLHGHGPVADLLRESGYLPDLHESALAIDWERFEALAAESPASVNADHPIGGTAMHAAAIGGAGTQIWRVYRAGGRPNESPRGKRGHTAVRIAIDVPDLALAELTAASLLGNGADPNGPERDGSSALHAAASRGSVELVEMLLRKGADATAHDADGRSPLELAERAGHEDVARLLRDPASVPRDHDTSRQRFDASGSPYRPPDLGGIPLATRTHVVGVAHTDFDELRAAVDGQPELAHSVATTTEAAVEASAHMGRTEMVDYLLDRGAACSLPTAVMRNDLTRARALLAEDPDRVRERGPHDFAMLWYPVIGRGLLEMAELLFEYGADVEQQHWLGTTALHYAAIGGQVDLGRLLIERGANVNRIARKFNAAGVTPLQIAEGREQHAFVKLLRDHGARG